MTYHVTTRWGGDESEPTESRLREVLAELDADDDEHPDASLTHDSEWCLSASQDGALVYQNLDDPDPRHMPDVSREQVLALWLKLAAGNLDAIEAEAWRPGYPEGDLEEAKRAAAQQTLDAARAFYDSLGEERADQPCRKPDCRRGAIELSVFCRPHHYESLRGEPCPFDH